MHFSSSGETPVVTRLVCASWTSRARIRNGSDEWTGEGTSFGVKCVFDGVVISPELFHRRLIGNVDERPLRFPAYRIPASRIARTTRELDSFSSLSLSPFFSFAFDFFFFSPPLFVEISFCFTRGYSEIVTRETVCMIFNFTSNSLR